MRAEIEAREPGGLEAVTDVAGQALAARFGHAAVDGRLSAHVVAVEA